MKRTVLPVLYTALFSILLIPLAYSGKPIATIGNTPVTKEEFFKFLELTSPQLLQHPDALLDNALDEYLDFRVVLMEAKATRVEKDPVAKELMNQAMVQAYFHKALGKKIQSFKVSQEDVKKFYELSPIITTRQILLKYPGDPTPESQAALHQRAIEILSQIRGGKISFEEAVKKNSEDVTRSSGGLMPESGRFNFVSEYYNAAIKLKEGEISDPVASVFGVHIIQLTKKTPVKDMPSQYAMEIETYLKNEESKRATSKIVEQLKTKYPVKVIQENLK